MTDYCELPAINWSTLKHIRPGYGSPKHYDHATREPAPDKPAFTLGRAVHLALYEPERFERECAVYPGPVRRGKAWEAFAAEHEGDEIVLAATRETALRAAESVRTDPVASRYILHGLIEHVITWTDPVTGLDCKGRVDEVNGRLSDTKTTASLRWFPRDAERFGYFIQMAWYLDGLVASGYFTSRSPLLIAVEPEPPYDVVCYELPDSVVAEGRQEYQRCLALVQECRASGEWPGVAGGEVKMYERPGWATATATETLTIGGVPVEM